MRTTGASYFQSKGLRTRAKKKGIDYDLIDWDRMQGKDLTYDDRLQRLEKMVGKTTTKHKEYSRSSIRADESRLRDYYRGG